MGNLSFFLAGNVKKVENVKKIVSMRIKDSNGHPVEWELKAITAEEDKRFRNSCTTEKTSRKGQLLTKFDYEAYMLKLTSATVVYPSLTDKELQDSYGVMGEEALLGKMLTPGEKANLYEIVQEVNDFDLEEKVAQAKN